MDIRNFPEKQAPEILLPKAEQLLSQNSNFSSLSERQCVSLNTNVEREVTQ